MEHEQHVIEISEQNMPRVIMPITGNYAAVANIFVWMVENTTPGKTLKFKQFTAQSGDKISIADYERIMNNG